MENTLCAKWYYTVIHRTFTFKQTNKWLTCTIYCLIMIYAKMSSPENKLICFVDSEFFLSVLIICGGFVLDSKGEQLGTTCSVLKRKGKM